MQATIASATAPPHDRAIVLDRREIEAQKGGFLPLESEQKGRGDKIAEVGGSVVGREGGM